MWIWVLLGVAVILASALYGAALYFFQLSIVRAEKERTEEDYFEGDDSIWNPFREAMTKAQQWIRENTAEHVTITSYDGLKLSALYIPGPEEPKGTMIVFHGYRSLATVDFAPEAEFLHSLGYRLLIPYQRSHGESEGSFISYGVKERFDCRDWALYAQKRFGENQPVFLMGISMGSATVMMASGLELPENVRGIVADCGFTSPWEIMKHVSRRDYHIPAFPLLNLVDLLAKRKAGFGLKESDSREALRRNKLPVLFLHGAEDDFVPVSMTEENFAACGGEKELYLVKGAGHAQSFSVDPAGCKEKIQAFVERYEK